MRARGAMRTRGGVRTLGRLSRRVGLLLGLPALLVAGWWYASAGSTHFLFPPLSEILATFPQTWDRQRLTGDVLPSLLRLAAGYGGALLLGVGLGVVLGSNRTVRAVVEPVLELLRAIPPPVLVPILALFVSILTDTGKVVVIVSGCLWPILLNTVEGVRAVDDVLSDTCRSYRIRGWSRLWHLVLRSASPQIMTGARQALAIGLILMVISELTGATNGIGYTVEQFRTRFEYPQMWSGVILLGLLGVGLSLLFQVVERSTLSWYHGQRATQRER